MLRRSKNDHLYRIYRCCAPPTEGKTFTHLIQPFSKLTLIQAILFWLRQLFLVSINYLALLYRAKLCRAKNFAQEKWKCLRRGKRISMVLVLWFLKMRARVQETFFYWEFFQLTNIDLVLKEGVFEKYETKSHYFIATSYYMQTKVQIVTTFYRTKQKVQ